MRPTIAGYNDPKLLAAIREALKQNKPSEAVQLFLDAQQKGGLPRGRGVMRWVTTTLGAEMSRALVLAFVNQPCVFCAKGVVRCERCEGKGHMDYTFVCEECFSLGVRGCRFCNGTGWTSLDFVPEGLRVAVLAERTKIAVDSIQARREGIGAKPEDQSPLKCFLEGVQTLVALNKDIGILENTVVFSNRFHPRSGSEQKRLSSILDSTTIAAVEGRRQICGLVQELASAVLAHSEDQSLDDLKRQFEKERARFYRSACEVETAFEGTFLEHPFLVTAIRKRTPPSTKG